MKTSTEMMDQARIIVMDYFNSHVEYPDKNQITLNDVFVVWFSKTLQNWKALVSTTVFDGSYYELTYNGDNDEIYVDVYKKYENFKLPGNW
jgi:regulatory protein YycI of two-component signal transduction system YycFG